MITDLARRVTALEEEVFPKKPPDFGPRLEKLERDLAELAVTAATSVNGLHEMEQKVRKLIEIVAELRSLVTELSPRQHFRTMTAGE
jgi:hypothetical protein